MDSSFVIEAVAEVALESWILFLGVDIFLVVDDGRIFFVFDIIGSSKLAFIRIFGGRRRIE